MILAVLVLLSGCLGGEEPAFLPIAGYDDEYLTIAIAGVTDATGWACADAEGATLVVAGGQLEITVAPHACRRIRITGPGRELAVTFVHPGQGRDLVIGPDGRLREKDDVAVLVLDRVEARSDRRWGLIRAVTDGNPRACSIRIDPPRIPDGQPALLATCAHSQTVVPNDGVLVVLPAADRLSGWKQREYRQVLAWMVCDLQVRGSGPVVLVGPRAARPLDGELAMIRLQVEDVALAYRCLLIDPEPLVDPAYWESSPGVLVSHLNDQGRQALEQILGPWMTGRE